MKRFLRHFVHYDLIPLLSMLAVCAFPCVFLYARNASEVPADSMLPFLVVFSLNALLFFGLSSIFQRNVPGVPSGQTLPCWWSSISACWPST